MATMRFRTRDASGVGLGWSLSHWPGRDPAEVEDDRPKATATEKLYRYHLESWRLAYAAGDEYPLEEELQLRTKAQIDAEPERSVERDRAEHPSTGRICPAPGCGVTLPERGFGPHLAKHRRDREAM